jgi:hypothetical protein
MRAQIEAVLRGELDPLAAAAAIGEIAGDFPGQTPSAKARARARAFLDLVLAVLADLARADAGLDPGSLAHGDLAAPAGPAVGRAGGSAARRLEVCLQARQDVDANLAPDAILERALLALEPGRSVRSAGGRRSRPLSAERMP